MATSGSKISKELDRIRESLLGPILAPSPKPRMKDLSPSLEDLRKPAVPPSPPPVPEIEIPVPREYLEELKSLQFDIIFLDGRKKRHLPGGIKIPAEEIATIGEGRCVKLLFKPKRA